MVRMRRVKWIVATLAIGMTIAGVTAGSAAAQSGPQDGAAAKDLEADPIRCWWRTSASAVRVGETFSLVLTCAVVENETTTVVPDQSRLEPSAIQLPPFEVVGGQRGPDLRSDQRRFFQYQYTLRLISEELFGRDARVPSVQVSYHLDTRTAQGDIVRGRDRTYILPTESVRVLSLVPSDATDIRDAPSWTFADIEGQRFRARVFFVLGGLLFAAALFVAVVALIRFLRQYGEEGVLGRRWLSDGAILRGVGRELSAVRRGSEAAGWGRELASRAAAALRIAGTIALGRRVGQMAAGAGVKADEGQLLMRGGWLRGKRILVSGSATTDAVARELAASESDGNLNHRLCLEKLQTALANVTSAQFGREDKLDEAVLNESLTDGFAVLRRLKFENLWVVKKLKSLSQFAVELGNRAWSR
jgi:hypothetical protein